MTLIKSISGIRGTLGGSPSDNLSAIDIVECAAGYAAWLRAQHPQIHPPRVVLGRDGRLSGPMVSALVRETLLSMGVTVIDLGLSTTPTVEMAVPHQQAQGGIIITASHNPENWNALKFLNEKGEFISATDGAAILERIAEKNISFASHDALGQIETYPQHIEDHVTAILNLSRVDTEAIRNQQYTVIVDCVNSTGALLMPALLEALGCSPILINEDMSSSFAHNPEPRPDHLIELMEAIRQHGADMGVAVDPDVDRLALVDEKANYYGEEYTLVTVADYILRDEKGHMVSNMSSTDALRRLCLEKGGSHSSSAVGEVNVVTEMKQSGAILGGEGNGGVIYPPLHYGRDAAVGVALILSYMAQSGKSLSALRSEYADLYIAKNKINLSPELDADRVLRLLTDQYTDLQPDTRDGLKFSYPDGRWVQIRKSNTEPILRIYAESDSEAAAEALAQEWIDIIHHL